MSAKPSSAVATPLAHLTEPLLLLAHPTEPGPNVVHLQLAAVGRHYRQRCGRSRGFLEIDSLLEFLELRLNKPPELTEINLLSRVVGRERADPIEFRLDF